MNERIWLFQQKSTSFFEQHFEQKCASKLKKSMIGFKIPYSKDHGPEECLMRDRRDDRYRSLHSRCAKQRAKRIKV